jgi:glutamyl-tRNA reductase
MSSPRKRSRVPPKKKNKPIFFIDIAVPRDVEPAINDLPNAYVYDIDDSRVCPIEHGPAEQEA